MVESRVRDAGEERVGDEDDGDVRLVAACLQPARAAQPCLEGLAAAAASACMTASIGQLNCE